MRFLLKTIMSVAVAAVMTVAVSAQGSTEATQVSAGSDSLARALATFWGTSAKLPEFSRAESSRFMEGVKFALTDTAYASRAYEQGLSLGANFNSGLRQMAELGVPVDREAFAEAVVRVLGGESVGFTTESAGSYIDALITTLRDDAMPHFTAESQTRFIEEAAAAEGAVTTASGLVFRVITEGEGDFPTEADRVDLYYTARLSDGTVFDQTEEAVNFNIVNLVPGLTEGIKMMRPGGTYRLVIPAALGYGERGVEGVIPPGSALDFTVTLAGVDRGAESK